MQTYTYEGLEPKKTTKTSSNEGGLVGALKSTVLSHSPTHETVKKHVTFLMVQALFIVTLAVVGMYAELQANVAEAENRDLKYQNQLVQRLQDNRTSGSSAILGAQDDLDEAGADENEIIFQDLSKDEEENLDEEGISENAQPAKDEYVIAVYGDSMVDTSGEVLEYLEHELKETYPDTRFNLYNYGMGSNNVDDGLARWTKPFHHQDRNYPPITEIEPDIIIVGSFAYNVYTPHDRNRHWLALTELVQKAQIITPDVYIMAEIAPIRRGFGFGPNGVNWDPTTAYAHTGNIIEQLKNAIGLAETLDVPLIDTYTPSLDDEGREEGKRKYVNPSDGIHPSVAGHQFISEIIVETIELK